MVTEREIEARVTQRDEPAKAAPGLSTPADPDLAILRQYLAASAEERNAIDQLAEERVAGLLGKFTADKHAGLREQAKIEATREYFQGPLGGRQPSRKAGN